jgi:putative zinc finger/helix-turn-helix YgiT family protein
MPSRKDATMKCLRCKGTNAVERETTVSADTLFGLPDYVLCGVRERECPDCGAKTMGIPRQEQLQCLIAELLSEKPESLAPNEIKFIRKHIGLSKKDFAKAMGVAYETSVRWESQKSPQTMGSTAEQLLRLLAIHKKPPKSYERRPGRAQRVRLSVGAEGWVTAA